MKKPTPSQLRARDRASRSEELARWLERFRAFRGWDFREIQTRNLGPPPSWDYGALVRQQCAGHRSVLDLGTGGGELLSNLRPGLPGRVVATEEWSVNAPIARARLAPLAVSLVRCRSRQLPFASSSFDFVINRHEEFEPDEVVRVLATGGDFLTQQVGPHDWQELQPFFPRMADFGDLPARSFRGLQDRYLTVELSEQGTRIAYPGLGEFVFMLGVSPWTIPGFDLGRDLDALLAFEAACLGEDGLVVTECRFLLTAHKPA